MKLRLTAILILGHIGLCAQSLHFKVIDVQTMKPLPGVTVTCFVQPKKIFKTDAMGEVLVSHTKDDTITFQKDFYYPVKININHKNYDFDHIIEVMIIPSTVKNMASKDIKSFDYHFVHDTLGEESHMKIKTLEPEEAMKTRNDYNGRAFRFTHIDIKGKNDKTADKYSLKPIE